MITSIKYFHVSIVRTKQVDVKIDDPEVVGEEAIVMMPLKEPKLDVLFEAQIDQKFPQASYVIDKNKNVYIVKGDMIEFLRTNNVEYFEIPQGDFVAVATPYKE